VSAGGGGAANGGDHVRQRACDEPGVLKEGRNLSRAVARERSRALDRRLLALDLQGSPSCHRNALDPVATVPSQTDWK
jgi:hypothetical protein